MRSLFLVALTLAACGPAPSPGVTAPAPITSHATPPPAPSPASVATARAERPPPPPLTVIPPGVDPDRARLAASLCAAAYDPARKAVGCRSHPPFESDAQQPDGTLPPFTGEPQRLCEIDGFLRGSYTAKDRDEALVVFGACQGNDDDTWDMGFPGSAVLVEQRDGRWQPTGYVPDVNLNACLKDRRPDGRDVLVRRSSLSTGATGTVLYVFVVDMAHDGARTIARVFSHDDLCSTLSFPDALDRGFTRLDVTSMTLTNRRLALNVRRAHVAAAPDLSARAKKACARNAKLPAIVPAGTSTTLEFTDDGTRFTSALTDDKKQTGPSLSTRAWILTGARRH